jgi:hypothetical protein
MSKIAVAGNASGTGTLTIAAPNTNSDRTLTLPDVTATVITDSAGVLNIGSGQVYKDGSGNVGIGTSSPLTGLSLSRSGTQWTNNSANTYPVPAGRTFVQMEAVAAQANWFGFTGAYGATSGSANLLLQVNLNNTSQQAGNYIASEAQSATAADLTFGKMVAGATTGANSAKSEQMRITSAGNVGIGTSSPAAKLDVNGTAQVSGALSATGGVGVYNPSGSNLVAGVNGLYTSAFGSFLNTVSTTALRFGVNGVEVGAFDTSGNFQVGFTGSQNAKVNFVQSANFPVLSIKNTNASFSDGAIIVYNTRATTDASYNHFACYNGNFTGQFIVRDSGNAVNSNNSYGAISDAKLKENIVDATPKLEKLNQVRIVNFNMIGDEQKQIGVIAQELEQIFPGMVEESPDRDAKGNDLGTITKSVKYSVFVPMLIKAMQEQQAIIESLKARLDAANL